jgi:hypothetical protein
MRMPVRNPLCRRELRILHEPQTPLVILKTPTRLRASGSTIRETYPLLLLPQSPEDEARFTEQIATWTLQHPTPTTLSPTRSGKWLHAFTNAANKIVAALTNPHKHQMRQGFSSPGLYLTHTLHTCRLIRRGLQGSEHHSPWDPSIAYRQTLREYEKWHKKDGRHYYKNHHRQSLRQDPQRIHRQPITQDPIPDDYVPPRPMRPPQPGPSIAPSQASCI